jgi:hypothetical protein
VESVINAITGGIVDIIGFLSLAMVFVGIGEVTIIDPSFINYASYKEYCFKVKGFD